MDGTKKQFVGTPTGKQIALTKLREESRNLIMDTDADLLLFVAGHQREAKSTQANSLFVMKTSTYCLWALFGACAALTAFTFSGNRPVRHMVVFKYKPVATAAQVREATEAFRSLKSNIPGILSFEHGENISTEKKDLGFNHVYMITFENTAARDAYLPHPNHEKFGELLTRLDVVEDVFVVDF